MSDEGAPVTLGDIRAGRSLVERVKALEDERGQQLPAQRADAPPDVLERLDRHRKDIDELKDRYNKLARYVQQQLEGAGQ